MGRDYIQQRRLDPKTMSQRVAFYAKHADTIPDSVEACDDDAHCLPYLAPSERIEIVKAKSVKSITFTGLLDILGLEINPAYSAKRNRLVDTWASR